MGRRTRSYSPAVALFGIATFALGAFAAKDQAATANSAAIVDFYATVSGVREVPAGNPMPGIHLDVKFKGRMTDIYLAPTDFVAKYEMNFSKGDDVHIIGSRTRVGRADVVLTREITTGVYSSRTLYLRNDDGPLWVEETSPVPLK